MPRDTFAVEIDRFVREDASVEAVKDLLIADVIAERGSLIQSGEASPIWRRTVNGVGQRAGGRSAGQVVAQRSRQ